MTYSAVKICRLALPGFALAMLIAGAPVQMALAAAPVQLAQSGAGSSGATGGGSAGASAKPAAPPKKPAGGQWSLTCGGFTADKKGACQVSQDVRLQKSRQLLLRFSVRGFPEKKTSALFLQMPHGVYLPDGVRLDVDGKTAETLVYQTCDQGGCYAGKPLSKKTLAALREGKLLKVIFRNLQRKDITIAMALDGFAGAYRKMMAK